MTKNEIMTNIMGIPGATMVRTNKTNYVVIPTDDGIVKVSVGSVLANDTKAHKAFNMEAAVAEYKAWEAESALKAAERASKPARVKGPNPEAQARRDELDAKITALPAFKEFTATNILNALAGQVAENVTVMAVGSSAKRLVEKGVLVTSAHEGDKKTYYSKV